MLSPLLAITQTIRMCLPKALRITSSPSIKDKSTSLLSPLINHQTFIIPSIDNTLFIANSNYNLRSSPKILADQPTMSSKQSLMIKSMKINLIAKMVKEEGNLKTAKMNNIKNINITIVTSIQMEQKNNLIRIQNFNNSNYTYSNNSINSLCNSWPLNLRMNSLNNRKMSLVSLNKMLS